MGIVENLPPSLLLPGLGETRVVTSTSSNAACDRLPAAWQYQCRFYLHSIAIWQRQAEKAPCGWLVALFLVSVLPWWDDTGQDGQVKVWLPFLVRGGVGKKCI